ncbi:MAG: energy transducer TonB [Candidatus Acidiferrales bacterium]
MQRAITLAALLAATSLYGGAARVARPQQRELNLLFAARSKGRSEPSPRVSGHEALLDDEAETERLVAKSHNLTNLTADGSAPFRFHASLFFYDPSGDARIPPARGSYAFTWAAPDKWREDSDLLHLKQIEIANGGQLWTKRNAPYPSYSYWWTRRAIDVTRGINYRFDSYTRVEISQLGGHNVVCAKNGALHNRQELCLDTATALPLVQFDSTLNLQFIFSDWAERGTRWYPRSIRAFNGTELVLQVEIASVNDAPPESSWIAPPQEATPRDWCPGLRPARLSDAIENAALPDPTAPPGATPIIGAIVYGVIAKDGNWLDLSVLESSDFKAAYAMLEKLRPFRNQPATCHGTPVESETIFRITPQPR